MNLITDYVEFTKFKALLPPLTDGYNYLLSLSARNKYLNPEERQYYNLGSSEMFGRTLVKDLDNLDYYVQKLATHLDYKKTRTGHPFPEKALVVYFMINPVDMLSAYFVFQERLNKDIQEIYLAMQNKKNPNLNMVKNLDSHLLTSVGKASKRKDFVDLDLDSKDPMILEQIRNRLTGYTYHVVSTHGGYHIIIPRSQDPFPPVYQIIQEYKDKVKEFCINKNVMIPLVGTLQAGSLVSLVD
jgi:hypothetical protein